MRQDSKSETDRKNDTGGNAAGARPDPAASAPRSQGGKGRRRVQGQTRAKNQEPDAPHYDPSGRWTERSGSDPYREEQGSDDSRQRFARGTEWNFRPDGDSAGKPDKH